MSNFKTRLVAALAAVMLVATALPSSPSFAQGNTRFFPETQKTVQGRFLQYWETRGGLAQQGYPISNEMQERSDTDGKTYTVQYFERAVFELHPENAPPNDVLLSLLGNFLYKQKYPNGAPGQAPSSAAGARLFPETGKRVGGLFLDYWQRNGGLAQQGFPISEEFQETSALDGKTYRVQYFERAVFEFHPENAAPYNVLLSQLGKFRYQAKYAAQPPPPAPPQATQPPAPPPVAGCDVSGNRNGTSNKTSIRAGESISFAAWGFTPNEPVSFWFTLPDGSVLGTSSPLPEGEGVEGDGTIGPLELNTTPVFATSPGRWALTFQGAYSNHVAVIYFCITR